MIYIGNEKDEKNSYELQGFYLFDGVLKAFSDDGVQSVSLHTLLAFIKRYPEFNSKPLIEPEFRLGANIEKGIARCEVCGEDVIDGAVFHYAFKRDGEEAGQADHVVVCPYCFPPDNYTPCGCGG